MLFIVDTLMQVAHEVQASEDEQRAIIKVLVDLLEKEGITVHMGLVRVMEEVIGDPPVSCAV